jgi:hypothetical protein
MDQKTEKPWFKSGQRKEMFLFSKVSSQALQLIQWLLEVKQPEHEAYHS